MFFTFPSPFCPQDFSSEDNVAYFWGKSSFSWSSLEMPSNPDPEVCLLTYSSSIQVDN